MIDRSNLASKRQKKWSDYAVYRTSEGGDKPKYYALDMFPYPSGAGLHVGHPKGYIATDVVSRQKKLAGYNVLHPMGFDSFGLPTENYAMKNKIHPSVATDQNIGVFIEQLKKIGFNYDRDRMVSTADPDFYRRTQWMFIQLYEHRYDSEAEKARSISELKQLLVGQSDPRSSAGQDSQTVGQGSNGNEKKYTKVLILDGIEGDGKSNWIPRLQMKLRSDGYDVQVPHLIANSKEDLDLVRQTDFIMNEYKDWIDEKTLIVGHSIGCILALHVIQVLQKKIDTVFVAPCFDGMDRQYAIFTTPRFADYEEALSHYYGQVSLDWDILSPLVRQCTVMLSTDDPYIPYNDAVKYFKKYIPDCQLETFMDRGHFNIASGCLELPEIFEYLKPMKYLIFDYDGVLADTFAAVCESRIEMGDSASPEEAIAKTLDYANKKPYHAKGHNLTDEEIKKMHTWMDDYTQVIIHKDIKLFDDFVEEIKKIPCCKVAIVSSNARFVIENFLAGSGLSPTHILGFESDYSKEEKIMKICHDRGCDVSDAYYFGDSQSDVYELENMIAPGKLIGCGRGFSGHDALCEVLPQEYVMKEFDEIHAVVSRQSDPRSSAGQDSQTVGQGSQIPVRTLHKSHYQRDEAKIAKLLAEQSHSEDGYVDVTCAYIRGVDGRIVLQHLVQSNIFVFPGGKVDKGETVEQAFIRECQEEVGITPTDYTLFGVCKIIHKGAPYRLWYYDVTAYDGVITNLEPSKHDLQYARIEPSDNKRGMQIVLDATIVSDADELSNTFRDIILCEKDFRDPRYKLEEWIDAPVAIESQDGEYITLWMDMATKQYVVRGQEVINGSKQQEAKTSPEIAAYHSRCRKQSLSDKENFHTLTDEEKIDRYIDTEKRLAFISHAPINRCPSCMTALANEDLDGNVCERCGTTIERRKMRQWMIRITDYAQRLLDGLELLPERQDNIKAMQRHWIGRSEGTIFTFQVANRSLSFDVYTTRIDTVYGVTFVSLAPEHALVEQITTAAQRDAVMAYVEETKSKTDIQRQEAKEKTGVRTGAYAINPFTNEQIPIWVADYVLMDYGTGAVMAVPAHDERDWEFAKKFGLDVKQVIGPIVGTPHDDSHAKDSAYGLIYNNDKTKILVVWRGSNTPEMYAPGGTIDEGETLEIALRREIQEETGLKQFTLEGDPIFFQAHYFVDKKEGRENFWRCNNSHVFVCIASKEDLGDLQLTDDEKDVVTTPQWLSVEEFQLYIEKLGDDSVIKNAYQMLIQKKAITEKGILVDSGPFTGMTSQEAIPAMQARLAEKDIGCKKIQYRIQDRVFSRQRYRGEPIPMLYVPKRKVYELRFRDAKRRDALGVTKTIETRAGNPDEKERFFGNIAVGDIIAAKYVETGAYKHFLVTKTYYWKQIADLRDAGEETMQRIYSTGKAPSSYEQLVSDFEAISPDYAERIAQHGLYGFAIEPYDIATDITTNNYQIRPMSSDELPLTLPDVAHYEPTGTEEGPLAKISQWIDVTLSDGTPARRESNTMPGRAGSSRYRIRYMDPRNANAVVSPEVEEYRGQVDLYVGGMEHACRHLIYARFRHKFLKDIGVVTTEEPFKRLKGVGLVLAEDGRKMSKRRGNVINPDDVIAEFGTDAFRTYEMFMGPFDNEVARSTAGVKGVKRFLDKVVKISEKVK